MEQIIRRLYENQDEKYRDFNANLSPTVDKNIMIGVRTPVLRALAKEMIKEGITDEFLGELPHHFFEENQLHAFILSEMKEYEQLVKELERFLPYIDNWATCDQLRPKIVKKHADEFLPVVHKWIASKETYTIRFGIGMLMSYYLDEHFKKEYLEEVASVVSDEYYVNMMIAWYLATALAKHYEDTLEILESSQLGKWVQNKTIQKARESFRVPAEHKEYLKTLRMN